MNGQPRSHEATKPRRAPAAFTMIELLVVIVVIALLIAIIAGVSTRVINNQRVALTQQIMSNVSLGIEQFAQTDPLAIRYNDKRQPTFGAFPPYELNNRMKKGSVAQLMDPLAKQVNNRLARRFGEDLLNHINQAPHPDDISVDPDDAQRRYDDNRALYVYLKRYVPEALSSIPDKFLQPLSKVPEFVKTTHEKKSEDISSLTILGIHDAWGVPLNYMLYARIDVALDTVSGNPEFKISERMPAVMSYGVSREVYDRRLSLGQDPTQWLFSAAFPAPDANGPYSGIDDSSRRQFWLDGVMADANSPKETQAGWVRMVEEIGAIKGSGGAPLTYGYLPDPKQDK
ncbi:MAG: hypothetical protein CHACPFDD_01243 [Phycisphaerae bacterium]|nr:hypothetical protein [Phycisphaerae bacterium]